MSFTRTVLTPGALALNAGYIAEGGALSISKIVGGKGDTPIGTGQRLEDESIAFALREPVSRQGNTVTLPLYFDNSDLTEARLLKEIGVYAGCDGGETLYAVSKADSPLFIPLPSEGRFELTCDLLIELSAKAEVTLSVSSMTFITREEVEHLFSSKKHRHKADEVDESTGETVEQAQRRQDMRISALEKAQSGTTLTWRFAQADLEYWNIRRGVLDGELLTTGGNEDGGV